MKSGKLFILSLALFAGLFSITSCGDKASTNSANLNYDNLDGVYASAAANDQGAPAPSPPPAVMVETPEGNMQPMKLAGLKADVKVVGNIATTTLHMKFLNKLDQVIEGQLYFPLLEGQTISRFAMDVNGKMRDGVIVEKEKGRRGFETVARRQIDPGLIEWTKGNNFKARIYPINPGAVKHVIVAYDQELTPTAKGFQYRLPLNFSDRVSYFRLDARVFSQDLEPLMDGNEVSEFKKFKDVGPDYYRSIAMKKYRPNKAFVFTIPVEEDMKDMITSGDGVENYFFATVRPKLKPRVRSNNKKIALVWDVSNSSTGRAKVKELKAIKDYFKKIKTSTVSVTTFSYDVLNTKSFDIKNGNSKELINYLINTNHDGGTQLGSVDLSGTDCDFVILSTDGISNFGKKNVITGNSPIMVINSNIVANHSCLNKIATDTKGDYINATALSADDIVDRLYNEQVRLISMEGDESLAEAVPKVNQVISNSATFSGRFTGENTNVKFNFGYGNEIVETIEVNAEVNPEMKSTMLKRIMAQKKLVELDMDFEKNKDEIIRLGKSNSIVTRHTSLIVLDRVEDYAQFGIEPPAELRTQYYERVNFYRSQDRSKEAFHDDQVASTYNQRLSMWERDHDLSEDPILNDDEGLTRTETITSTGMSPNGGSFSIYTDGNTRWQASASSGNNGAGAPVPDPVQYTETEIPQTNTDKPVEVSSGDISIKEWDPKRPYIDRLKKYDADKMYDKYITMKEKYGNTPSFYLDVAGLLKKEGRDKEALQVLSNVAELELENHELLRALGRTLEEWGNVDLAINVFEDVLEIRGEEPQSYRDLGLLHAKKGNYQKAVYLLSEVVNKDWDGRFPGIETIAAVEINAINQKAGGNLKLNIPAYLQTNMPCDLRVVMNWDADNTNLDLTVTDSRGEKCSSSHMKTTAGGYLSSDYTTGYGPEEFWVKDAVKGKYKIRAKLRGKIPQRVAGPVRVSVSIYTDFGKESEKLKEVTATIDKMNQTIELGEVEIKN